MIQETLLFLYCNAPVFFQAEAFKCDHSAVLKDGQGIVQGLLWSDCRGLKRCRPTGSQLVTLEEAAAGEPGKGLRYRNRKMEWLSNAMCGKSRRQMLHAQCIDSHSFDRKSGSMLVVRA
jgi:hypothetical protein